MSSPIDSQVTLIEVEITKCTNSLLMAESPEEITRLSNKILALSEGLKIYKQSQKDLSKKDWEKNIFKPLGDSYTYPYGSDVKWTTGSGTMTYSMNDANWPHGDGVYSQTPAYAAPTTPIYELPSYATYDKPYYQNLPKKKKK